MSRLEIADRVLAVTMWLGAAIVVLALLVGPSLIGADKETTDGAPASKTAPAPAPKTAASGEQIFKDSCSACHTLAVADASGSVGPNLDDLKPDAAAVAAIVKDGGGAMPSFGDDLSDEEITAVADFVSSSTQ